jgi:ATP-dependent DNA helicase RecQ
LAAVRTAIVACSMEAPAALRSLFGFERFRPGQAEAVAAALADRDALVVMPTGSGKSLCYQLPALMRENLTLVVSPLVSLMQDQEAALSQIAPGKVGLVNSSRAGAVNAATVERAVAGEIRLLYVAPERFALPGFVAAIQRASVGLFAVDEAHCVSQWGHDFRPDYFTLADAARRVGARSITALTATATPAVAGDIARRLALRDPVRVTTGFDRPNLSFAVIRSAGGIDKSRRIAAALAEPDALPAIVYAGTRDLCEKLARELSGALGVPIAAYHAGLGGAVRARIQDSFMSGAVPVIVATNAFGMGVDKADVRTVCHASVPGSLEAYYQEAGRAGRDGRPARCLLFAEQRDKGLHVFFIERARIPDGAFARVSERLRWAGLDGRYDIELRELAGAIGARPDVDLARAVIGHLARAGLVAPLPAPPDRAAGRVLGEWGRPVVAACTASARDAERARWSQYRSIWGYVEQSQCRRSALLRHFGDTRRLSPTVACCDVCDPAVAPVGLTVAAPDGALDSAIVDLVRAARPPVGRTRAVEILRGGRSKVVEQHGYDSLGAYGSFAHLRGSEVLERVDELLAAGTLRSTGGRFPKLRGA